jgi:hypothetical protein
MARPEGTGSEDTILGSKSLPRRAGVFRLLRLPIPLEMESVLEVDAVGGLREPEQDGRFSDPDIDARLDHCDIANPPSGFPLRRFPWA